MVLDVRPAERHADFVAGLVDHRPELAVAEERALADTKHAMRASDSSDWEVLSKQAEHERKLELQVQEMIDEWSELGEQLASRGSSVDGSS